VYSRYTDEKYQFLIFKKEIMKQYSTKVKNLRKQVTPELTKVTSVD